MLGPGTTLTAGGAAITISASVAAGTSFPATVVSASKATGTNPGSPGSRAPLVVTIGGKVTTIQPTVITGSQGPVTGFVIAPGSTLLPGGSAIVISGTTLSGSAFAGTTLSLPKASGPSTGSRTGTSISSKSSVSTITNTLGVGDIIASGIGFTSAPAVATGSASYIGSDVPIWCLSLIFSAFGGLAIWL